MYEMPPVPTQSRIKSTTDGEKRVEELIEHTTTQLREQFSRLEGEDTLEHENSNFNLFRSLDVDQPPTTSKECTSSTDNEMSEMTTIDNLPCEMLIKICRMLDKKSLKNAALTCKLWNEITESACRWSVCLKDWDRNQVNFRKNNPWTFTWNNLMKSAYQWLMWLIGWRRNDVEVQERIEFMLTTNRKFCDITLDRLSLEEYEDIFVNIFRRHGWNVSKLALKNITLRDMDLFIEILKCLPNLKELILQRVEPLSVAASTARRVLPVFTKIQTLKWCRFEDRYIVLDGAGRPTDVYILYLKLREYNPMG
ncbi:hypothetical protein Bhyg_01889 [Pseudolycoriella hygida]|uniref:F-box domain-containing protein n=1 Tax=Pseudolycoriella hygida TaxID=35572 RepID=A0A9Q0NAA4_9DIPT|nr:hypothetical protein Bhyg_01889 [Pseudolycoriella hygida]